MRRILVLCGALALAACGTIVSLDEYTAARDGGATIGAGSDGGASTCAAAGGSCAAVPAGWSGPVILQAGGTTTVPCVAPFPDVMLDVYAELADAGPARCGCTCESPKGNGCDVAAIDFFANAACNAACNSGPVSLPLPLGVCVPSVHESSGSCTALNATFNVRSQASGGSCAPRETIERDPVGAAAPVRACGAKVPPAGCAPATACVPPPSPRVQRCVYTNGAQACPADWSVHKSVGGYLDKRACTACVCGAPTGATCNTQVLLYSDSQCNSAMSLYPSGAGSCYATPGSAVAAKVNSQTGPTGGSCPATPGVPTGTLERVDEVTFCCKE